MKRKKKVSKILYKFFNGVQFLRDNNNDFILPKINEILYPKKKNLNQLQAHEEKISIRHCNKIMVNILFSFSIPKYAVIELFENINNE